MGEMLTQNAEAVFQSLEGQNKKLDDFETTLKGLQKAFAMLHKEFNDFKQSSLHNLANKFDGGSTESE